MRIDRDTVVTLAYELKDCDGELLEDEGATMSYLHGGYGGIFPKVETALQGSEVGHEVNLTLEPEDAFGDYDAKLVRMENVADLPPDVTVGGYLVAEQDGNEVVWRVTDVADGKAVLDGNHELAGQRLRFDAKVLDVRPATAEEISHGHIHGAHGHHH